MLLVELELAIIAGLLAYPLLRDRNRSVSAGRIEKAVHVIESDAVEIVKRVGDMWLRIGHRHSAHPDVTEALNTPGLAVRYASGAVVEGKQ